MGCRRDGVGTLGDHTGFRNVPNDLLSGQMTADPRLGALAHFNLDSGSGAQIVLVNAEPSGCDLDDSVFTIPVEVLMKAAFARIIKDAELGGGSGQALVGIIAQRSVAHSGKQNRNLQLQLGL